MKTPVTRRPMTARHHAFVEHVLAGKTGTQAAIDAGFSPGSASSRAAELNAHPEVIAALEAGKARLRKATDYMVATTGFARPRSQREVERYCTMIGQACSYKVGHMAWTRARAASQKALGARFDLKQFHEVLKDGAMPLTILERRIAERTALQMRRSTPMLFSRKKTEMPTAATALPCCRFNSMQ